MHPWIIQLAARERAADMQKAAGQSRLAAQARRTRPRPGLRALSRLRHTARW